VTRSIRPGKVSAAFLISAFLILGACGSDDSSGSVPDVDGREFISTEVVGHQLVEGSTIRLAFEDGSVAANAGCNSMSGGYTFDGDILRVEMMAMTEMGCDEALMDQDAFLSGFLTSGPTVAVDGDEMTLVSGEEQITFLDREVADPDRPLEGTLWIVDGIVSDDAVSSTPAGAPEATLMIEDGQANVDTSCNSATTSVEVTGTTLTFGPMATTLVLCEFHDLETAVLTTLSGEVEYEIEAGHLSIRHPDGTGLEFRAAE
jgi:heat shock protein HslJ